MFEPTDDALPLTRARSMVVISDRIEWAGQAAAPGQSPRWRDVPESEHPWRDTAEPRGEVRGGYLERLPLACIAAGIVDRAEIWHHRCSGGPAPYVPNGPRLGYRGFHLTAPAAPLDNTDMLAFVQAFGAPHILVVYGLGVSTALLAACARSIIVYNSIDVPTLRVPPAVSAHFDLVLTGAAWQSDEVERLHPGMRTAIMPVGPEFAAIDQFRPLGAPKDYDVIYVAAAQPYKRHDILLDTFGRLPRDIRGLCLFGYGEDAGHLRSEIAARQLAIDCIGPPGVAFDEVNRLMNRAKLGVVCGRDDGAPAILTEYMLAGLPVLVNEALACGRQYITAETGEAAAAGDFANAIMAMRNATNRYRPREAVLAQWTWPHTVKRFAALLRMVRK